MARVGIQIVAWNGLKYLPYFFSSLQQQTYENFNVRILDNNSTDGTKEWLKEYAREYIPNCAIEFYNENIGFSGGHNLLFSHICDDDEEYVLLANQDVVLSKKYIETLVKFLDVSNRVGSCSGLLKYWNFEKQEFCDNVDSSGIIIFRSRRTTENVVIPDIPIEIFGVSGTLPLFRRSALNDVAIGNNIFDPLFDSYKEDVDLAYRLQSRGWDSYIVPDAIAYHDRTVSVNVARQNRSFRNRVNSYRNHLITLIKNEYVVNLLKDLPWIFVYEFKKALYLLFFEPCVLLRAWFDIFWNLTTIMKHRKLITQKRICSAKKIYDRYRNYYRKL